MSVRVARGLGLNKRSTPVQWMQTTRSSHNSRAGRNIRLNKIVTLLFLAGAMSMYGETPASKTPAPNTGSKVLAPEDQIEVLSMRVQIDAVKESLDKLITPEITKAQQDLSKTQSAFQQLAKKVCPDGQLNQEVRDNKPVVTCTNAAPPAPAAVRK